MPTRRYRGGLAARIVAWPFVPALLILGAVAVLTVYSFWQVTAQLAMERNQAMTEHLASQIAVELAGYADLLDDLAMSSEFETMQPAYLSTALRWSVGRLRAFDGGVVVLDDRGTVVAADPRRPDLMGADWSERDCFPVLAAGRQPLLASDVSHDGPDGAPVVSILMPIWSGNPRRFVGVAVGMFRLDTRGASSFYRDMLRYHTRSSRAYLVDAQGRVIVARDIVAHQRVGMDASGAPAVQAVLAGQTGALRTRGLDGEAIIASFAPVPDTTWGLVEEESWAELTRAGAGYMRLLLGLLALGVAVPVVVVTLGVRRITRPIAALAAAARGMAEGKLRQAIEAPPGDELADLAAAFNRMSAELQDLYSGLERKVADRTRELAALNEIARVVSGSLDLREILDAALARTVQAMDARAGAAYHLGEDGAELVAWRGLPLEAADRLASAGLTEDPAELLWLDRGKRTPSDLAVEAALDAVGWPAAARVPILAQRRVLGWMWLARGATDEPTADQRALLRSIGQQVGLAVENARLFRQAEESAALAERSRLANELHDSVTQTLFSANLIAGVLPLLWEREPEEGRAQLEALRRLTQGALAEMRTLLLELRPNALAAARLEEVLAHLAEAMSGRAQAPVALTVRGTFDLPAEVKVAAYRIAQEALNNVVKHSGAVRAEVRLERDDAGLRLTVSDDGCGFDPERVEGGHLGLGIMRERAEAVGATLEVESRPGAGATVRMHWPAPGSRDAQEEAADGGSE